MTYRLREPNRRMLYCSEWCGFGLCTLPPGHPLWRSENIINDRPVIALPWTSVVIDRASSRNEFIDPNSAVFYHAGQPYRRHVASAAGERCAFINPSCELIRHALEEAQIDGPDGGFPFASGPAVSWATRTHHALARSIESGERLDPIEIESTLTEIVRQLVGSAVDALRRPRSRRLDGTRRAHRDLVEGVRHEVNRIVDAESGARPVGIEELARCVHTSPYHLCRVFKNETGQTIGTYFMQLRLRVAAERVAWSDHSITNIAHRFGFSSHAHFTSAWSAEFGSPPSQLRRARF